MQPSGRLVKIARHAGQLFWLHAGLPRRRTDERALKVTKGIPPHLFYPQLVADFPAQHISQYARSRQLQVAVCIMLLIFGTHRANEFARLIPDSFRDGNYTSAMPFINATHNLQEFFHHKCPFRHIDQMRAIVRKFPWQPRRFWSLTSRRRTSTRYFRQRSRASTLPGYRT
ncbi:MAG: hypothetical protein JWQ59_2469 [Cryobacterium sp.]|nr:hypothetical protein [Cryobacterium sp.]